MKKLIFVLVYSVAALSIFSYGKSVENEQLSIALSGQYASKMTDASAKLEELDTAVKKTLLFNEADGSSKAREDIWRLSSDIKNSVSSLPMDPSFSTSWMNYLGRLGNFAKDANHATDNAEYHRVMKLASKNLRSMADEWGVATADMVGGGLSIDGWKKRLDADESSHDWAGMGTTVKQYTESDFPLTASESDSMKKKDLKEMKDPKVTRDEAVVKFKKLFPYLSNETIGVEESKPGSPYPFYHIRFAEEESIGYIDITEKGGHVLSFLAERPFGKESLPFEDLKKKAESFLKDAGYKDLVYEEARENNTAWHMVYVRVEPKYGAKVFSDTIHLKIAKDNGGIVGLDASEYIRKEKTEQQPITQKDWKKFFHSGVTIVKEEYAYVENEHLEQRLTHYFTVTLDENGKIGTYAVVVDTETSEVIKTEKLQ
ncbi:PepSY1/2 domain-containing protein [Sporosarcina sp. JAI121]|uniref:PepSY1/2 domain-containing protein n=1 Tax=Sporosarcina sp. JAI121 TaxID=2723064 RepID=UPI0015CD2A11|nr:PepSY1/2 domain-containing protein [Sporosarcina sp. JAI121]NYF24487.1 spore germination protein [Sporosarcina sp. JAI121]